MNADAGRARRRRLGARELMLLAFLAPFACARHASALEIGLEISGCSNLSTPRVRELMELELTTKVVLPRGAEPLAALVSVACESNEVSIRVTDATTSKLVVRTFSLAEAEPDVRARAVALAAAELVLTSWMELMLARPPADEKPAAAPLSEDRRAASNIVRRRTERGARVDALLALAAFGGTFRAAPGALGGGLRLSFAFGGGNLGVDADVSATFADESTALGQVRSDTWSVALRPALRFERGRWLLSAGVGARVGLARIEGSASDPSVAVSHVVAGGWGGPLAHANFGVAFGHVVTRLGGECGFSLRRVSGSVDGLERAGVHGAWFLLTLGVGWGA